MHARLKPAHSRIVEDERLGQLGRVAQPRGLPQTTYTNTRRAAAPHRERGAKDMGESPMCRNTSLDGRLYSTLTEMEARCAGDDACVVVCSAA